MKDTSKSPKRATYGEILTQPQAWQQAIDVVAEKAGRLTKLWTAGNYSHVIFTGCGSTYYLSIAAAALFQELTGRPARAVPAGELILYPAAAYAAAGQSLLVAVSRSAKTSETIQAVKHFKQNQAGDVVTVANYDDQPLASMGAVNITIPAGREESVAQTRSFASMYVATTAIAATLAKREDLLAAMAGLPECGPRLMARYEGFAQSLGQNLTLDRFYFLGSGPRYGLACEVNLKMKEMTLTHSEPFHFLEFRHGPMSMATDTAVVIGLLSEVKRAYELAVLNEMKQLGARVVSLGESETDIDFDCQLPEAIRNVLYLPVLQLAAYYRSLAKGLNPDNPQNLTAVVELDLSG